MKFFYKISIKYRDFLQENLISIVEFLAEIVEFLAEIPIF